MSIATLKSEPNFAKELEAREQQETSIQRYYERLGNHPIASRLKAEAVVNQAQKVAKAEGAEGEGLVGQAIELGLNTAETILPGGQAEKLGAKIAGKNEGIGTQVNKETVKPAEEKAEHGAEKAAEAVTGWAGELGELLSPAGLLRIGKVIAGALVIIFGFYLLAKAIAPGAVSKAKGLAMGVATHG